MEDGYWLEYCGNLFPKTEIVKGTVYLGDNTGEYDIYLQYENTYSHLFVSRTSKKYQKLKQEQDVHFDENGIGIMKLDSGRYFEPSIIAYDTEGTNIFWMTADYSKHFLVLSSILFYNKSYEKN